MANRMAAIGAGSVLALAGSYYAFCPSAGKSAAPAAPLKNRAFVFVKPHAVTDSVNSLVRTKLEEKGLKVKGEGELTSEVIDEKKLIDQHYYAIASKATILKPEDMNVPADKFKKEFGKDWNAVLASKQAFNALDACKELGVSSDELAKLWAGCKKSGKLVKFGGGFYCGEVSHKGKTIYCFNGFFMDMRGAFTKPGRKIHFYDVEWDEAALPWADFRAKVLGPTDPKDAPADSLRGIVFKDWKKLGLTAEPNVGDNAVHASASPFEGLAERMNWMGVKCANDDYCKAMVAAGIPEATIEAWTKDPQVRVSKEDASKKKSLFDSLEDQDAKACLATAKSLAAIA